MYDQLDQVRRWQGQWLDRLGLGPIETPSRVVLSAPPLALKAYGQAEQAGPAVLIIPAPIKRAYIWDLVPSASVVQQYLRRGVQVYMIQWEQPGPTDQGLGLAEYADQFILTCLDAIEAELGPRRVFLAGHSLGGTLAAIFTALHSERVQGLTLLEAPIQFGSDAGAFAPLLALAPRAQLITALLGNVPGSFLNLVSMLAAPTSFQGERLIDWMHSLGDKQARQIHIRVERWTLDEMPQPRQLFEEVVEYLYRENRFMNGTLIVGGQSAAPARVDVPIMSVIDPRSHVVPPQSVLPFHNAVASCDKRVLWYRGDVGVALQHVGILVGKSAHQEMWPAILDWMYEHYEAGS
jgi:polyhydroxyalkanoate synthase